MPVMKSKNRFAFDREAQVTLKAIGSAGITATAAETGISLKTLVDAYWDNNEIPDEGFKAVVNVDAERASPTNETYVLTVEVDTVIGFSSVVVVGTLTLVAGSAVGPYEILLDGDTISALEPGALFIRINATLAGTAPELTYHSWLVNPIN